MNPHATSELIEYLPDCHRGRNKSDVFIRVWPEEEIANVKDAIAYLARGSTPLVVSCVQGGENLTVLVLASERPRIEFGRRAPTGNRESDLQEILSALRAIGIDAKLGTA